MLTPVFLKHRGNIWTVYASWTKKPVAHEIEHCTKQNALVKFSNVLLKISECKSIIIKLELRVRACFARQPVLRNSLTNFMKDEWSIYFLECLRKSNKKEIPSQYFIFPQPYLSSKKFQTIKSPLLQMTGKKTSRRKCMGAQPIWKNCKWWYASRQQMFLKCRILDIILETIQNLKAV